MIVECEAHIPGYEPAPHPLDRRACWQCHGCKTLFAATGELGDGSHRWEEVVCWRCDGTGREPPAALVERGEEPGI